MPQAEHCFSPPARAQGQLVGVALSFLKKPYAQTIKPPMRAGAAGGRGAQLPEKTLCSNHQTPHVVGVALSFLKKPICSNHQTPHARRGSWWAWRSAS